MYHRLEYSASDTSKFNSSKNNTHVYTCSWTHIYIKMYFFFLNHSTYLSFLQLNTLILFELPVSGVHGVSYLSIIVYLAFLNYKSSRLLSNYIFFFTLYHDQSNLGTDHLNTYNCLPASSFFPPSKLFWTLLVGESLKQNFKLVTLFQKSFLKGG